MAMGAAAVIQMILLTISTVDGSGTAPPRVLLNTVWGFPVFRPMKPVPSGAVITPVRVAPVFRPMRPAPSAAVNTPVQSLPVIRLHPIAPSEAVNTPVQSLPVIRLHPIEPPEAVNTSVQNLPVIPLHPIGAVSCTVADLEQPCRCEPLDTCEPLMDLIRRRRQFPRLCDFKGGVAYACCPSSGRAAPMVAAARVAVMTLPPPLNRTEKISRLKLENGRYCGKIFFRPKYPVRFIRGGKDAAHDEYPFMAALFRDSVNILNFWCGGTLITRSVILSAAHCFHNSLWDTHYIARIGGVNLSYLDIEHFTERHVISVHVHPDFDDRRHYNDVALLFLNESVDLSPFMRPLPLACLPEAGSVPNESAAIVLGWGHDKFGGRLQAVLQHARIPLIDTHLCERRYQGLSNYADKFPRGMKGDFICAGDTRNGGVDACQQDSGGPLVTYPEPFGQKFFGAIGIVSFGVDCGSASYPGVYTRVSNYVDWILNVMADVLPDEETVPIE